MESDRSMGHPVSFDIDRTQSQLTGDPSDEVRRDTDEHTGSSLLEVKKNWKDEMQKKYTSTSEGNGDQKINLENIYSEVIITTGESEGPHEEHTFRHITSKLQHRANKESIKLSNMFRSDECEEKPLRTVLTKGVAGIGKSFTVQKFILDWAKEKENQDIDFVFCLAFREINLIKGNKSLHELLTEFHPALPEEVYIKSTVIVILDGLDESRLQLDFDDKKITSVREATSVGNLLANLIQGELLPQAKLWITSRPAAASQIPAEFVDVVTEITGFSDSQKEEYYRRRFGQNSFLAERIISHIHQSQTLDIMCQIPIFCWISALLFEEIFEGDKAEIPQTLTEMMAHYLFAQTKRRNRKYEKTEDNNQTLLTTHREFLLKLGKLAFVQLQNNNLIFYDDDLKDCGIDMKEATIYSGFCSAILREEEVFSQKKTFFFVHLTIQEFFAALFVYDCLSNMNTNELSDFLDLKAEEYALIDLLKMIVDKVLEDENGHLDFFLRFLVGLMVEPNRRVLHGLLTPLDPSQVSDKKILTYLKAIRRKAISPDDCINLFQAMVEMRDHKVKDEIEEYLKSAERRKTELTPLLCSALAYMLQVSKNNLDVLDLKSYNTSDEGRRRLIPAVRSSRKAILVDCKVTEEWIEHLAFGLKFPYMPLEDLDLTNNDLKDSGVKALCAGLSSQNCRLKILRLSGCQVTEAGCAHLASALRSNPSHLMELDLSYNNLGDSGVKLLTDLKDNPQFKLNTLNVEHGGSIRMKPGFKKYACELTFNPDTAHKNLVLSEENRKVTWVDEQQPYPRHAERFNHCHQVLCEQSLNGRCYLEVEVQEPFIFGLTYKTIGRKGNRNACKLGRNNQSWAVACSEYGCHVLHNNQSVNINCLRSQSSQLGVYLDWPAGFLSFYRVTPTSNIRLHTYKTEFSHDLYAAIALPKCSSAKFCQLT